MILVASTVEANLVNTSLSGALGHNAADQRGGRLVAAVRDLRLDLRLHRAGRDERGPGLVVDHLGVDVFRAAEDRQPGPFGRAGEPVADPPLAPQPSSLHEQLLIRDIHGTGLFLLSRWPLATDYFDPKALPALRRTNSPS